MWYLGGKKRQSKMIVEWIRWLRPDFHTYVEPFCGAMWSACAVIKAFPGRKFVLNDANPYLMRFWTAAIKDGWDPPRKVDEATYNHYKRTRPLDDPMTGYLGFAWSFGGKFFGGAARTDGTFKGSVDSTVFKVGMLRGADVTITNVDFTSVVVPLGQLVYMDPPYEKRTKQSSVTTFDRGLYYKWAVMQSKRATVLATEFVNPLDWPVLHDYGDTVVRHLNGKSSDGTHEFLLRVRSKPCASISQDQ